MYVTYCYVLIQKHVSCQLDSITKVHAAWNVWMRTCAQTISTNVKLGSTAPTWPTNATDVWRGYQGWSPWQSEALTWKQRKKPYSFVSLWFLASSRPKRSEVHAAHMRYCLKCLNSCPSVEYVRVWLSANSWNMHVSASWLQSITSLRIFGSKFDITSLLSGLYV